MQICITVREKRKSEGSNSNAKEVSEEGFRKRAKMVNNILDHTSKHDKNTKAALLAKIIDKEGAEFGQTIKDKSKVMQQTMRGLSLEMHPPQKARQQD